jgi:hypothetical protein
MILGQTWKKTLGFYVKNMHENPKIVGKKYA